MRGFVIFLGLLLMLGGGAVAGAQYAPIDLSTLQVFDQIPGSREFLKTPMALYAGGGAAGFGFLLIIIAAVTGGKKTPRERAVVKPPAMARETAPRPVKPTLAPEPMAVTPPSPPAPVTPPMPAAPKRPPIQPTAATAPPPPKPAPVQPLIQPAPVARPAAPVSEAARAKPQASAQPPATAVGAPPPDPRIINRKRVQDLVTINDALKAYQARNGAFPQAATLAGLNERGANWIPGLAPDFLKEVPCDPMHGATTQYVYVSDGANYKLLAAGVSLVGSPNVEVLGIKIDPTRNPTAESASFGFWTPGFSGA